MCVFRLVAFTVFAAASVSLPVYAEPAGSSARIADSLAQCQLAVDSGEAVQQPVALGSTSSLGQAVVSSRGMLIAQTWRDWQAYSTMGRTVSVNPVTAGVAAVQLTYIDRSASTAVDKWGYAALVTFSNYLGNFRYFTKAVVVQDPYSALERGLYPKIYVAADGRAILSGLDWSGYPYSDLRIHLTWDTYTGDTVTYNGEFGDIWAGSVMAETIRNQGSLQAGTTTAWPTMAVNEFGGQTTVYLAACESASPEGALKVFRKVGLTAADPDNNWTLVFTDTTFYSTQDIACDRTSDKVSCVWTKYVRADNNTKSCDVWMAESPTGLPGTWTRTNLTHYSGAGHRAWVELSCLYDTAGKFHVIWNGAKTDGVIFGGLSCRLFHWSQWNPATISTVYWAEWDANKAACQGGYNVMNVGNFSIAECDGRLYTVFSSYNDWALTGHNDDCGTSTGIANGEYFVTVATDLQGTQWDAPRNLSNSYTPACGAGTCADDRWGSLALNPVDDADFPSTEVWPAEATYDPSGSYTGTKYLHLEYITDRCPGAAALATPQGPATLNDVRWIRLACVQPGPALPDLDGDKITDVYDNCPLTANANQADVNGNGVGDVCESSASSTPAGSNVTVTPTPGISLRFDQVTTAGATEVTQSPWGEPPPSGFTIIPTGSPTYYEIVTSALHTGSIEVCITYDPSGLTQPESELILFHRSGAPATWQDITTSRDPVANLICGTTTSLSPFILGEPTCCTGTTGNVNMAGIVDVSDLSMLVAYLTSNPPPGLLCPAEANINAIGIIDVSDLSLLVAYLTASPTPALPNCP